MNRLVTFTTAALLALVVAAPALSGSSATITIRHQVRGCHTWSFNGGAYKASQSISLAKGTKLTVIDIDIMPHKLVQVSGPTLKLPASAAMHKMGASTTFAFTKAGTYKFTTKPGEDYMSMSSHMKTIGEDYVLKLTVVVY